MIETMENNAFSSICAHGLIRLLSVGAPFGQACLTSRGFTQMNIAVSAHDDSLGMAENSRNLEASRALDVHKERVGGLYEPLQLVCAGFNFRSRV